MPFRRCNIVAAAPDMSVQKTSLSCSRSEECSGRFSVVFYLKLNSGAMLAPYACFSCAWTVSRSESAANVLLSARAGRPPGPVHDWPWLYEV